MSRGEPQRLATWLLTRCTPEHRRDSLVGDLIEQYEDRGGWWYWRQALGAVRAHAVRLLVTATESEVPAAECIEDLVVWVALAIFASIQLPIYADLFISWTSLIRSDLSIIAVSTAIASALIGAATTIQVIRAMTARATLCSKH
jgi:hypothetical protein